MKLNLEFFARGGGLVPGFLGGVAVVVIGFGGLVGCATEVERAEPAGAGMGTGTGDRFGPGYPAGSAAWSAEARVAFRNAFMNGMADRKEGFRYDDDRGALLLDAKVRGFYRQGYRRGYYHKVGNGAAVQKDAAPAAGVGVDGVLSGPGNAASE